MYSTRLSNFKLLTDETNYLQNHKYCAYKRMAVEAHLVFKSQPGMRNDLDFIIGNNVIFFDPREGVGVDFI